MTNVIQLFGDDPSPLLEGAEREAAIEAYRKSAAVIAAHVIAKAFSAVSRMPGCAGLGCDDVIAAIR